jgi:hypothetical protein
LALCSKARSINRRMIGMCSLRHRHNPETLNPAAHAQLPAPKRIASFLPILLPTHILAKYLTGV